MISAARLGGARFRLLLANRRSSLTGKVFDIDARQRHAELALGGGHRWQDNPCHKLRAGLGLVIFFNRNGGLQNVVHRHAAAISRQLIAAPRTANAFKDSTADQRLQNGFQMARRQAVARRKRFCGDRLSMLLHCDVNDSSNGQNCFTRQ